MIYVLLKVIVWATEIAVCKQVDTCEHSFVLFAAVHQCLDVSVWLGGVGGLSHLNYVQHGWLLLKMRALLSGWLRCEKDLGYSKRLISPFVDCNADLQLIWKGSAVLNQQQSPLLTNDPPDLQKMEVADCSSGSSGGMRSSCCRAPCSPAIPLQVLKPLRVLWGYSSAGCSVGACLLVSILEADEKVEKAVVFWKPAGGGFMNGWIWFFVMTASSCFDSRPWAQWFLIHGSWKEK